ncbi:MAG: hypothetical protein A3G23_00630 [Bacteroidetes bacterium RIFCSPLOWO2_12_FULL_37_12]|nr:MAG: hypothetical protein A3G23_00630 [Bacteroidetes bacterium RIFCSPLOWO2_12_FULL_37_12]
MKKKQKLFLDQFDQPLHKHIINFCNIISTKKYDVFILLARKAACFIDTLIELDLIEINGKIVSDRVLEFDNSWLIDKSVAIIDDTIISGTSIYKLIKKLEDINTQKIDVYAFCINEYWYVEEMLLRKDGTSYLNQPYLKLNHTSSLKFCKNIVDALSIAPRPYNIDFPIYENIKLSSTKLDKLFESPYWKMVDTTSIKQNENNIFCYTINPTKRFIEHFNTKLDWDISDVAHLKLRLYAYKIIDPQNKITFLSKIVPFIIFNPISVDNANKIIKSICNHEKVQINELESQLKTDCSKLNFIQFYYAKKLFRTWIECTKDSFDIVSRIIENKRSLYFLFAPKVLDIINLMQTDGSLKSNEKNLFLKDNESLIFGTNKEDFNPVENLFNLTKPFLDLYYKKELPARRIVKKINKKAFEDSNYIDVVNRLDDGISVSELKQIISNDVKNFSDTNRILSLFLDNCIDNGIIVPITINKNGYIYRGYRHGEEIIWGNYKNRLLGKYFEKYLANINANELPQTYFQKLLVLFLKIGLKEGFLQEYDESKHIDIKTKLLSVKAHLFGMVSDYIELDPGETKIHLPIIDANVRSYWTSKFLQDIEIITLNENKNFIFNFEKFETSYTNDIEHGEPSDIDQSDLDKVYDIADIFGFLRKNKQLNEDYLVLLTSCVNLHDNTASLAAELQIYLNGIDKYKYKIVSGISSGFTVQKLKKLRDLNENFIWTAINSGYFKFLNFSDGQGLNYIKDIEKYFEEQGKSSEARIWRRYWKFDVELSRGEVSDLNLVNKRMGHLLLEANITFAIIHMLIYELLTRQNKLEEYFKNILNTIDENKQQIKEIENKLFEINPNGELFRNIDSILVETLTKEKKKLQNRIQNNTTERDYLHNYLKDNFDYIEKIQNLLYRQNLPFENSCNYSKICGGYYKQLRSEQIIELIKDNLLFIDKLTEDIKVLMQDYKLTVPEWGKVQQKVKYNAFIHINSNERNIRKREEISKILRHYLTEFEIEEFGEESNYKTINLLRISNTQGGYQSGSGQIIGIRGQFILERLIKLSCKLLSVFHEKRTQINISAYPYFSDDGVEAYYNNQTKNFDIVKYNLFNSLENNNIFNKIIIFDTHNKNKLEDYLHHKLVFFQNKFFIKEGNSSISNNPNYIIELNMKPEIQYATIGIVTALPKEFAAMRKILDIEVNETQPKNDNNDYAIGFIKNIKDEQIKVVIALMKEIGTNNAASTATNLLRSFENIDDVIVCGIAGGIPYLSKPEDHVRLGDIVVSDKSGILQYDNLKETADDIIIRSTSAKPSSKLLGIVNLLIADYECNKKPWINHLKKYEGSLRNSNRPNIEADILTINGTITNHPFDKDRVLSEPKIFHGSIGSSNTLLKNEKKRDILRDKYAVKAIEMEGSGIADGTWSLSKGYLIVRGIVDYCNSDKNDEWHNYAAICAACYTKSIIERL